MKGKGAAAILAALLVSSATAQDVQEEKVPGVVHLRGGDTLKASDIKIDGLLANRGVELEADNKEYYIKLPRIDSMRFLRVRETANRYVGSDSRIRVTLKNGETITATNAQLSTRAEITYTGKPANEPRTRPFFLNGSKEFALSDPDDVVRIDFRYGDQSGRRDNASP
ncbi:hypothetical protein [Thiohalorhabdus methylotrophus]|uniref:Lipopolysaccharide export system protein LptA n=1 Tax=Thiohalorhabdus methylotrophus TaxID=3242694 RepID=A0ABV4TRG4_9GAMM